MAKTVAEIYESVVKNPEMIQEYLSAESAGTIEEFARKYDCEATADEIKAFIAAKLSENKELSVNELEQVAGGKPEHVSRYITCSNCKNNIIIGNVMYTKCPKCGKSL